MIEPEKERVYIIDVLRFVAAFGVLLYHLTFRSPEIGHFSSPHYPELNGWTRYLDFGVPLFFVISGFVIFYSVQGKKPLDFVWSRGVRLYPTYWLCCTVTFLFCHFVGAPYHTVTVRDWLVNLTMLQTHLGVMHVDGPYWTLIEELRFYAITFVLMLAGQVHRRLTIATVWMALCAVDYWVHLPLAHYELTLEHAPMFAAGIVFFDIFKDGLKLTHGLLLPTTFALGLTRYLRWSAMDQAKTGVEFAPMVTILLCALIYLVFFLISTRRLVMRERRAWVTALGGMTYPLYLIHNSVGILTLSALVGVVNRWCALLLVCVGLCAFAFAVWRWFETPVMKRLRF